ncbi:MAG TPA: alpha/beta fold hydrolase [Spongiibacteraceae bacterium]|nr:alpha/beta fold hydrolase [Spongiibacteraceae bacterium]
MQTEAALPLHYTQHGVDGEWVLLLHGLFGSGDNLGALAKVLAAEFRVLTIDLRNHGRSPHSSSMSQTAMAADILALQDKLGIANAHLVGHSLGGKVAMQVALNNPERVARLVVADIAPVDYPPHHQDIFAGLQAVDLARLKQRGDADAPLAQFVAELPVRQFLLKSLYRDETGFHWRFNLPVLLASYKELLAAPSGTPFRGPTLFIKGELSNYIVPEYEAKTRRLFPNFTFKMIAGTGHWLHGEKPLVFNKLVQQFLMS